METIYGNLNNTLSSSLDSWGDLPSQSRKKLLLLINEKLEQGDYPVYEDNCTVILFCTREAKEVRLNSDITGWTDPIPFKKLEGTAVFYLILKLEPDARIEYQLLIDNKAVCDPHNKYKSLFGLGALSELAMPLYPRHPYLNDFLYGKAGGFEELIKHILPAGALPYEHEIHVWLPPGYNSSFKYPVVYFQDGPDYIRFGYVPYVLQRLINDEKIIHLIAVFVTPPNLHQPAVPNRSTEYGMNDDYVSFFCNEAVNFIDETYSTDPEAEKRIVIGDSYGGLISFYISFKRPDVFLNAYSQSGYFSFKSDKMIRLVEDNEKKPLKLYLDIGTYERKVGADFLPAAELDFTSANRRMNSALLNKEYDFRYLEYPAGHTWGSWKQRLIHALIYFFSTKEQYQ